MAPVKTEIILDNLGRKTEPVVPLKKEMLVKKLTEVLLLILYAVFFTLSGIVTLVFRVWKRLWRRR